MRSEFWQRHRRWLGQSPVLVDVLLAAFVTLLGLVSLTAARAGQHSPDLLGVVLVLLSGLPVVIRSAAPIATLAVTLLASLTVFGLGYAQVNGGLGALFCLYSVAALRPRRTSLPVGIATLVVIAVALAIVPVPDVAVVDVAVNLLAAALFWGAGAWSQTRRRYVRGLEERNAALLQARESQARASLVEARGAVAREIQDVVGHSVMAMTVQATAARRLLALDPEAADAALAQVEGLGRTAIDEVRRVLGLLGDDAHAETRPQPGLDQIEELVDAARSDGLDVELEMSGFDSPVPAGAGLTVYRVVEEALRNATQHAGPARVVVKLRRTGSHVEVSVSDDGRGAPSWRADSAPGTGDAVADGAGRVLRRGAHGGAAAGWRIRGDRRRPGRRRSSFEHLTRTEPDVIKVLLVDDQPLLRTGFSMVLQCEPDLTVVGEAADGAVALAQVRALQPDVVLMDIRMPNMDGIEATRRITAAGSVPKVLVLTTFDHDEYVVEALRAGASGFLLKDVPADDLVEAVRVVHRGEAIVAPSVTRRLLDRFADHLPSAAAPTAAPDFSELTEREREVLLLVARGMSNAEIAAHLVVSETTVKTHVSNVLAKLGLRDRVQAVVLAYESRLVAPS
ncbi:response regulator [Georgenia sp. SUBG003]|uniref:response regulator n=1 Tax=Georgenia sp. SUBG003 TaxID=1497974 RepID=UPI003AB3A4B1